MQPPHADCFSINLDSKAKKRKEPTSDGPVPTMPMLTSRQFRRRHIELCPPIRHAKYDTIVMNIANHRIDTKVFSDRNIHVVWVRVWVPKVSRLLQSIHLT